MVEPLYKPSPERVASAHLTRFRAEAAKRAGEPLPHYDALHAWSVAQPDAFWQLVADFCGVQFRSHATRVLGRAAMPGSEWFPGATLNFAENLLRHSADATALICVDESGSEERVSFGALRTQVARLQRWLQAQGVGPGSRVAAWLPNRVEAVVTMLAASSLGAIYSSCSPDFGVRGVVDRFGQIAPTVFVASTHSRYAGKTHDLRGKIAEIVAQLPPLAATLLVGDAAGGVDGTPWAEALSNDAQDPSFAALPFDHPLYILYSSGTTGAPKCIVHGQGGTLLQHAKEHHLHTDLGSGDVLFYFTTTGWMMWNWLVSGLFVGATVVLWDGSPAHPSADALWSMAERLRVNVFGTSPRFLSMCAQEGLAPGTQHDLSALRAVLSTGSPLSIENFRWVYSKVGSQVQLASISGGTDIVSCFMLGCPTEPVYPGEIQKRGLGMAVEAWDGPNSPVVGKKAELVCTQPFPSMPVKFWNDPDGVRYRKAYFEHFPGVWRHGDWIELTERGGVIVYGRSDATLNPGGVRIGTAEIYRPVDAISEVRDSLVLGVPEGDDVAVVLYVVVAEGVELTEDLAGRIKRRIRELASPRHVPARIHAVPAIPRTVSGKKVELATLQVLQGEPAPNREALANPEALDWFAQHAARLR